MYCDQCGTRLMPETDRCPRCSNQVSPGSTAGPEQRSRRPAPQARTWVQTHNPVGGVGRWIWVVLPRNPRGVIAGLLAAWFNLPLLVFVGAVGAVYGGIGGVVSGTIIGPGVLERLDFTLEFVMPLPFSVEDLLPTGALQIGGIIGGLWGSVNGALTMVWRVASGFWELLYEGDPIWPWAFAAGQVVTAFFVGTLYTTYSIVSESGRLQVTGARRPSRREAEWLVPIMREVAGRLGSPSMPVLLIDESMAPNAYAGTRHIVVNQGLLDAVRYDDAAIAGVLAHELAHWRSGDAVVMAWGKGVAWPIFVVHEVAFRMRQAVRWGPGRLLISMLLWCVTVTVRYFVVPMHAAEWRRCEYRADAAALKAGYGDGLRTALERIQGTFDGGRSGWDAAMCATHPHTELRLERLEQPGGEYPLPYGRLPSHPISRAAVARAELDKD